MDSLLVEYAGRIPAEGVVHKSQGFYMDPIFGIIPMPLLWNLVTVLLVAVIFWWLIRGSHKHGATAEELLKKRYVSGDIDRKTYLQMKEDIAD